MPPLAEVLHFVSQNYCIMRLNGQYKNSVGGEWGQTWPPVNDISQRGLKLKWKDQYRVKDILGL